MTPEEAKMFTAEACLGLANLRCPYCKSDYLHGFGVREAPSGSDGRPSYGIKFNCERCPKVFVLWFINNKGITYMEVERDKQEEDREEAYRLFSAQKFA